MIPNGKKISLEYTVFLEDGTPIDSNIGEHPLTFVLGNHEVFPALEDALKDLDQGDSKQISLKPEQAYGTILAEAFREVPTETVPLAYRHVGAVIGIQDPEGGIYPIRVHQVNEERVILDFNHPLAGKALKFQVKILDVS